MSKSVWLSGKTYTHAVGLSCCFRQHKAQSHCKYLHGYALEIKFTFSTTDLDENGWVVDFGGLKDLKAWLELMFDHKCLVAHDDPSISTFRALHNVGLVQLREVPGTGCEKFAEMIYAHTEAWLKRVDLSPRCSLVSVEVREHGANSASFCKLGTGDSVQ
jgi:6-pyruvoyltetrahydropterin/6-carboxytetrahydropterin synthase